MDHFSSAMPPSNNDQLHLQSPEAVMYKLDIAGIGARSHAFIIDWHIRLLLALSWFLAVGLMLYSIEALRSILWGDGTRSATLILFIPTAIIYFLYHPILEIAMQGRTPGKRMAGIRIVTTEGLTPSAGALLVRNIFRLLDSLPTCYIVGLTSCIFTRHRVRIGDLAASLLLVYDHTVDSKEMQKVADLAMNSNLKPNDQALLLDLLKRWPQLHEEDKTRLAERFLKHVGEPTKGLSVKKKQRCKELYEQLQHLSEQYPGNKHG